MIKFKTPKDGGRFHSVLCEAVAPFAVRLTIRTFNRKVRKEARKE